jgi:hypothetical protein
MAIDVPFPTRTAEFQATRTAAAAGDVLVAARLSNQRRINFVLNVTLPGLLVLSFLTGWMASMLGLTEFGLHKYSSIAVFVVALMHVVLHWRSLAAQIRRRLS